MKIVIEENFEKYSERAASLIIAETLKDKKVNMSLTSGNSPIGAYKIVIDYFKAHPELVKNIDFFNFDSAYNEGATEQEAGQGMTDLIFAPAGIKPEKVHTIMEENYEKYDEMIADCGGLDLMMIGLGGDGHFCANMPHATNFLDYTYKVKYDKAYDWYNFFIEFYKGEENIPDHMYTMGTQSLMKVKHLVMIVNGKSKAPVVRKLLTSEITNEFPSSVLKLHPNLTIILDKEAASESLDLI